jgi:hypothetical protein
MNGRKAMAKYPYEFAQDAAYQSHTNRLTELWSLPRPTQGLNTYNKNNNNKNNNSMIVPNIMYTVQSLNSPSHHVLNSVVS